MLVQTRQELEVAVENAQTARHVVWELFQDLEGFRLDDYREFDDGGQGMRRLIHYFRTGIRLPKPLSRLALLRLTRAKLFQLFACRTRSFVPSKVNRRTHRVQGWNTQSPIHRQSHQ
jgi:hypothetical protein